MVNRRWAKQNHWVRLNPAIFMLPRSLYGDNGSFHPTLYAVWGEGGVRHVRYNVRPPQQNLGHRMLIAYTKRPETSLLAKTLPSKWQIIHPHYIQCNLCHHMFTIVTQPVFQAVTMCTHNNRRKTNLIFYGDCTVRFLTSFGEKKGSRPIPPSHNLYICYFL